MDRGFFLTLQAMRRHLAAVLRISPGHLQAWIRVSLTPLEPPVATSVARHLAVLYGADPASADWRHCGRLAGFTNQKPTRRQPSGYAPWAKLVYAQPHLATHAASLLQSAPPGLPPVGPLIRPSPPPPIPVECSLTPAAAIAIYSRWLRRLQIPQRFSPPDWSIADLWIAKRLLRCRIPADQVQTVLRFGSPGFPRHHSDPEDYLRPTLAKPVPFPARRSVPGHERCPPGAPCVSATLPLPTSYYSRSDSSSHGSP